MGYTIQLITPTGSKTIECPEDEYILAAAERNQIQLPYSCRSGVCGTCTSKLENGSVDQDEQSILDEDQLGEGYVQVCVAYPRSACTIRTHQSI